VLHLLNGTATTVETTLAALQKAGQPAGQVGTVVTIGASNTLPTGPTAIATPPMIGGGTTFPTSPSTPSSPPPPTTPVIPPNLLGGLINTLQAVIDGVLNLLPHDGTPPSVTTTSKISKGAEGAKSVLKGSSSASSTSSWTAPIEEPTPTPTPTPSATSNGLLGDLLGGLLGQH
jgi:hypothetical protein